MEETWKAVNGYEGLYEVSDEGRVRSLDRIIDTESGYKRPFKGRVLKPGKSPGGYLQVNLRKSGRSKSEAIHRMVCRAFNGSNPEDKPWVLHTDGNKENNRPENLRWGTPKENTEDTIRAGMMRNGYAGVRFCKYGHEFIPENTTTRRNGSRACRTCQNRRYKESRARHQERYREEDRMRYQRRDALRPEDPRHGTPGGYNNWKCRCDPCKEAHSEYKKERRRLRVDGA